MKNYFFFCLIGSMSLFFMACGQEQLVLSPTAFQKEMANTDASILLDVRTEGEYKRGHLQGALNCNINGAAFDQEVSKLDTSKVVLVYCGSGVRSAKAATALRNMGFSRVIDMEGGITAWKQADLPVQQ
jgi:thioredoxin 1